MTFCEIYGIKPMSHGEDINMPEAAKATRNNKIHIIDQVRDIRKMLDTIEFVARTAPERNDADHSELVSQFREKVDKMYDEVDKTFYFSCTGKEKR